jgi:hypothetical protein
MANTNPLSADFTQDDEPDAPEADAPEADEPVVAEAAEPIQRTPITRRQRAADRDASILKELRETRDYISKQAETHSQEVARIARENAELRGQFQGYMSRPPEREQRQPPAEDPKAILREANALLDAKDFSGYQERYSDYVLAKQAADPRFKPAEPTAYAPPQVSPMLQMVASQYVDVMSDRVAFTVAQAQDRIMAEQGIPESPERWKKAFEEGRRYMGQNGQRKAPQFSQRSAAVLSSVPTSRNGTGGGEGGEPGVMLNPTERAMAKKFKMSEQDYAAELAAMHPERVERG